MQRDALDNPERELVTQRGRQRLREGEQFASVTQRYRARIEAQVDSRAHTYLPPHKAS